MLDAPGESAEDALVASTRRDSPRLWGIMVAPALPCNAA